MAQQLCIASSRLTKIMWPVGLARRSGPVGNLLTGQKTLTGQIGNGNEVAGVKVGKFRERVHNDVGISPRKLLEFRLSTLRHSRCPTLLISPVNAFSYMISSLRIRRFDTSWMLPLN